MRRTLSLMLACAVVLGMMPGLVASATETVPTAPVWGGGVVTDEATSETGPAVAAGVVVWQESGTGAVKRQDLHSADSGVVDGTLAASPDISGSRVVWADYSADDAGDIALIDLAGGGASLIAAQPDVVEAAPAIDGDIVAWRERTVSGGFYVGGVDLSTDTTFTAEVPAASVDAVAVSGGTVAFAAGGDIFVYDVAASEVTTIAEGPALSEGVAIGGDIVVWAEQTPMGHDIYAYDLSTDTPFVVCAAEGNQYFPAISGDLIVWQDARSDADWDIYAYDMGSETEWPIAVAAGNQMAPDTDGSHIVWVDDRNTAVSLDDIWWIGYDTIAPATTSDVLDSYLGSATISLAATDDVFGSGVEKTWYKVDYVGSYYDGPFTVVRPGHHTLHFKSYDNVGNLEEYNVEYFDLISVDTTYTAISGPNRYDTAVATSQQAFPKGTARVVIATGENWPDALGGAALAKAEHAAVLLTLPTALPANVLEEIVRLRATEAIILGGVNAVSSEVEAALKEQLGEDKVSRIEGADRYETAEKVALATREAMGYSPYKVLIATGTNFPDALGASPLAALGPWPILLAPPASGLTEGTKAAITDIGAGYGVILGGENAVASHVETDLATLFGEGHSTRLAGEDRYATSIECAKFGVAHGLWWDGVALSTGANFPDALAGGMLQGQAGSVLLLTPSDTLHPAVADELAAQRDWIGNVTFLGGTAAVSQDVRDAVAGILK